METIFMRIYTLGKRENVNALVTNWFRNCNTRADYNWLRKQKKSPNRTDMRKNETYKQTICFRIQFHLLHGIMYYVLYYVYVYWNLHMYNVLVHSIYDSVLHCRHVCGPKLFVMANTCASSPPVKILSGNGHNSNNDNKITCNNWLIDVRAHSHFFLRQLN